MKGESRVISLDCGFDVTTHLLYNKDRHVQQIIIEEVPERDTTVADATRTVNLLAAFLNM